MCANHPLSSVRINTSSPATSRTRSRLRWCQALLVAANLNLLALVLLSYLFVTTSQPKPLAVPAFLVIRQADTPTVVIQPLAAEEAPPTFPQPRAEHNPANDTVAATGDAALDPPLALPTDTDNSVEEDAATSTENQKGRGDGSGADGGNRVTFFGIETSAQRIAFVVDRSQSMRHRRLSRVREELVNAIGELDAAQQFGVYLFSTTVTAFPLDGTLRPAEPSVLTDFETWIRDVEGAGGTRPEAALSQAISQSPDGIILLSDGRVPAATLQVVKDCGVPIHTICFIDQRGETILRAIARLTGGTYQFVSQ